MFSGISLILGKMLMKLPKKPQHIVHLMVSRFYTLQEVITKQGRSSYTSPATQGQQHKRATWLNFAVVILFAYG